jgi:hypothetical protein
LACWVYKSGGAGYSGQRRKDGGHYRI